MTTSITPREGSVRCAFCHDVVMSGSAKYICGKCKSIQHFSCYSTHGRCATCDRSEADLLREQLEERERGYKRHIDLLEEQRSAGLEREARLQRMLEEERKRVAEGAMLLYRVTLVMVFAVLVPALWPIARLLFIEQPQPMLPEAADTR